MAAEHLNAWSAPYRQQTRMGGTRFISAEMRGALIPGLECDAPLHERTKIVRSHEGMASTKGGGWLVVVVDRDVEFSVVWVTMDGVVSNRDFKAVAAVRFK